MTTNQTMFVFLQRFPDNTARADRVANALSSVFALSAWKYQGVCRIQIVDNNAVQTTMVILLLVKEQKDILPVSANTDANQILLRTK